MVRGAGRLPCRAQRRARGGRRPRTRARSDRHRGPRGAGAARSPDGEVRYTMVLRHDGSALLARDTVETADVVLVEDWGTARAIASGESVSDLLTAGRIKVRGDSRALVAGGEVLARVAPLVGAALGGGPGPAAPRPAAARAGGGGAGGAPGRQRPHLSPRPQGRPGRRLPRGGGERSLSLARGHGRP